MNNNILLRPVAMFVVECFKCKVESCELLKVIVWEVGILVSCWSSLNNLLIEQCQNFVNWNWKFKGYKM